MLCYVLMFLWPRLAFEIFVEAELEGLKEKAAKLEVEADERRLRAAEVHGRALKRIEQRHLFST